MLKRIILKLIGKNLAEKWNLKSDPEKAPMPGEAIVSIPWWQSKTKVSMVVAVLIFAVEKLSGPVFGHPIVVPEDAYRLLEFIGLYGLRDAIKKPL